MFFLILFLTTFFVCHGLKCLKKVLKRPDLNFGILSHNSLLCNLDKQLWKIINTILVTDIFVLCEIKIWRHCSWCQIILQKFLWFTKYSSLLRKQSYTEILIWTEMSSLSIHVLCLLPYLLHLLREMVLKMATLLNCKLFADFLYWAAYVQIIIHKCFRVSAQESQTILLWKGPKKIIKSNNYIPRLET